VLGPASHFERDMISNSTIQKAIQKALGGCLLPLGFKKEKDGFSRWDGGIYTYIACPVHGLGRAVPFGQMGFRETQKIFQSFMHDPSLPSPDASVDVQIDYAYFARNWSAAMQCLSNEDLPAFLAKLKDFILLQLYPVLDNLRSEEEVLDLYLRKDETNPKDFEPPTRFSYSVALTGLILARLVAYEQYQRLKTRYSELIAQISDPVLAARIKALISYLDQPALAPLSGGA